LPHKSKISKNVFNKAAGPRGWNAQQGFYIYRNERLLVAGEWLGMFKKEEHYKLCRIMIDLPNTLDDKWQIDIKKSIARPPLKIYNQLKAYANLIRSQAVNVYRHKGKVLQRKYPSFKFTPVWLEKQRQGKRFYSINREHPVINEILSNPSKKNINELIKFIEETVPVPLITIKESENPESHGTPFENIQHEMLIEKMESTLRNLMKNDKTKEEAAALLLSIEPFDKYPQYVAHIIENL
jgi:truncated hemoglobin YjbI